MSDTPEVKPRTPREARDDFITYIQTLPLLEQNAIFYAADKLFELVLRPHMLNAFVLVNAELAVAHAEGNLLEEQSRVLLLK